MVTKSKKQSVGAKRGRVKLGKLKLKKETVKNLSESEVKNIKGGAIDTVGCTGVQITKKTV
jgi:natural product precursor